MSKQSAHRALFVTWGTVVGLRFLKDVLVTKQWPCPGRYYRMSGLYLLLSLFAEAKPELAAVLGVGFAIAFMGKEAAGDVPHGHFFGIRIGRGV